MTSPVWGRRFNSIVLDVDSTLSGIEGIDWLAERRGELVLRRVAALTADAMRGAVPLEEVYGARLGFVRPRRDDADALARAYVAALAPGAIATVRRLRMAGMRVAIVSGGLRHSLFPLAARLDVPPDEMHAVSIRFDAIGAYLGYDRMSPLTTADGKRQVVASLDLPRPILAVGDGATDLAMRGAADAFVAYTGFVHRDAVVKEADAAVGSFDELASLVLP